MSLDERKDLTLDPDAIETDGNPGHNVPRLDAETIEAASTASVDEMNAMLTPRSLEIVAGAKAWETLERLDDATDAKAADFDAVCSAYQADVEKEHKARKGPYWDAGKRFDAAKNELAKPVSAAQAVVGKLLRERKKEMEAEKARLEREAQRLADQKAREAEEAAAKAAEGGVEDRLEADRKAEEAKAAEVEVKAVSKANTAVRGSGGQAVRGRSASTTPTFDYSITNWNKAALSVADDLDVRGAILRAVMKRHKANLAAQKAGEARPHVLVGVTITEKGTN